jgi:branched-chain amino acid transport system permease protein
VSSGFTVGTPLAVALTYAFVIVVSVAIELAVFRPLRTAAPLAKLVASLECSSRPRPRCSSPSGRRSIPQPTIIPIRVVRMLDGAVPLFDFVLSGAVVAITVLLWALYRWTRFGLATRAASENDVAARLAGLSPDELSLANTLLASLLLGTLGIFAGSVAALDTTTLALPRRAGTRRSPLRETHVVRDRLRVRPRHRHARVADRAPVDEVVVPDH